MIKTDRIAIDVTSGNNAYLINKGGFGSDRPGFHLNYWIWLNNRGKVSGGFETPNGNVYFDTFQGILCWGGMAQCNFNFWWYAKAVNTLYRLYRGYNGHTKVGTTPENNGKQPIRLGANSPVEKGLINGNYTGQLDDIQVWNFCFYKITSSQLI